MISQDKLHSVMDYDPNTGDLTWKVRKGKGKPGLTAGVVRNDGYRIIFIDNRRYYAHRLAYFWMTGSWPRLIDHADGNRDNQKFSNLRPADHSHNVHNSLKTKRNTTGAKGVSFSRSKGWVAHIMRDRKSIYLGTFESIEGASEAYQRASVELYSDFARKETFDVQRAQLPY